MNNLENPVFYLEQSNYQGTFLRPLILNDKPLFLRKTIVLIQSSSCGFCTRIKPLYQKIAQDLQMSADFATIQTDNTDIRLNEILTFQLEGVPTIIKYVNGKMVDVYQGNRTYDDFKSWILK